MNIKCPKCKKDFSLNIREAIDEHGEVFLCPNCGWQVRYTLR